MLADEVEPRDAANQCAYFLHEILYAPDRVSPHAYFAGNAAAASVPGDPNDDPARRRAFWLWYLDEAVPAAFAGDGQPPVMT